MTKKKVKCVLLTLLLICALLLLTACDEAEDKENSMKVRHIASCGDGNCSVGETSDACPQDCSPEVVCGDEECDETEDHESCPDDCEKPVVCGDDECDETEDHESCPDDCEKPIVCGDDECDETEDHESCPDDCDKPALCGDGTCEGDENCNDCARDCGCETGYECKLEKCVEKRCASHSDCADLQLCQYGDCIDVACNLNADCEDDDVCTRDKCAFAGNKNAYCTFDTIKEPKDNDGCCPRGYECEEDDDCCTASDNVTSEDDGWITGTISMPPESDNEHLFFDFSAERTTTDPDDGDIFFNLDGDLRGECSDGECAEIREEDGLDFNDMIDPPSSGYGGMAENINEGDRFWIRTLEGDYAKIYITDLDYDDEDDLEEIDFRWGYQE